MKRPHHTPRRGILRGASALCLLLATTTGCVFHLDRNAPGSVNLSEPPRRVQVPVAETPRDPGEEVLRVTAGPYLDIGSWFATPGRSGGALLMNAGVEVSISRYSLLRSHGENHFPVLLPAQRYSQLNLGWAFATTRPGSQDTHLGPLYLEYQRNHDTSMDVWKRWGWAVGYAYNPSTNAHGPQATLRGVMGAYNLRAGYLFGQGAFVGLSMSFPRLPLAWVWSQ